MEVDRGYEEMDAVNVTRVITYMLCNEFYCSLPSSSLLVVLEYSYVLNPLSVIIVGAIGASLGELTGYMVGVEGELLLEK